MSALSLTALGSVVLLLVLVGVIRGLLVKRLQDPMGIFLLTYGVFYIFRAVLITTRLDTPSPDYLFASSSVDLLLTKTTLGICLFLAVFTATAFLVVQRKVSSPGLMFHARRLSIGRLVAASLVITALAVVVEVLLLAKFGSFGAVVRGSKVDKALSGLYLLKAPCGIGALVATATFFELRAKFRHRRGLRRLMLACALLDSVLVFSWGARSVLVIVAAMLILVGAPDRGPAESRREKGSLARIVAAAFVVILLAVFLRDIRDGFTSPGQDSSFAQASLARRASQGLNGTYYDASMLAFRDWPSHHEFRGGIDLWNGFAASVPSFVWPDKPPAGIGVTFRQVYQPEIKNGWPLGAPTMWYLNFGWWGVVIGGAVSGLVIGQISRRYAAAPWSGMNVAMSFTLMVFVVSLGWESQTPSSWVRSAVPLLIVMRLCVAPRPRRSRRAQSDADELPDDDSAVAPPGSSRTGTSDSGGAGAVITTAADANP